ncbi:hypothetical protein JCM19000A_00970 [Silvimonas sp. JCM 19000]
METVMAAGVFKTHCLKTIDAVAKGDVVIITKHGKPLAKLVPMPGRQKLFGALRDSVIKADDLVSPIEDEWEAAQ